MKKLHSIWLLCLPAFVLANVVRADENADKLAYFEQHIRPLLISKCYECHSADTEASGGLLLDSRAGWELGGDSGAAIMPGDPKGSRLLQAVEYRDPQLQMPPEGPLPPAAVEHLRQWISQGAIDPREALVPVKKQSSALPLERAHEHWAYRPVSVAEVPAIEAGASVPGPIDAFIAMKHRELGLAPSATASRREIVRRLSFDLLGMPPEPAVTEQFESNNDPDAYDRLVDRLLASPRLGERMARRWMDLARYAESLTLRGFVLPQAWRYRDYLIESFRADRPFQQMILEQLAGDLLDHADLRQRQQQLIATSFLALGNTNLEEQDKNQLEMDYIDEQLEVIGRVFLGQTLGCARCHDHKFDPIPTRDYYALAGIFKASQAMEHENVSKWMEQPLPLSADQQQKVEELEGQLAALVRQQKQLEKKAPKKKDNAPSKAKSVSVAELPGIVIDDAAAKKIGTWQESTFNSGFVDAGYIHDQGERNIAKSVTYAPNQLPTGDYEVRMSYAEGSNRSQKTPVTVFSADGEKTIIVNQREAPSIDGLWISLGKYRFEREGQAYVVISNEDANGHVIADAIQFLPLTLETGLPATASSPTPTRNPNANQPATGTAAQSQSGAVADKSAMPDKADQQAIEKALQQLKQQQTKIKDRLAEVRPAYLTVVEKLPAKDIPIHVRGNVHNLGTIVPRGFLQAVDFEQRESFGPNTSGRLELAKWLGDPRHPLTARVAVNRLWLWLNGAGLVRSVDNFGTTGEHPSHPELLDYLAEDLVRHDWSLQAVMRRILLSATYQRATSISPQNKELDPENRWLTRSSRKPVDAEVLRDAMLQISGELTQPVAGTTLRGGVKEDYRYKHDPLLKSVYLPILRNSLPELFEAFDFPNPSISIGQRSHSAVAPQALAMLNSPWIRARASGAANRLLAENADAVDPTNIDWNRLIDTAYAECLNRLPTQDERYAVDTLIANASRQNLPATEVLTQIVHGLFASLDFRFVD